MCTLSLRWTGPYSQKILADVTDETRPGIHVVVIVLRKHFITADLRSYSQNLILYRISWTAEKCLQVRKYTKNKLIYKITGDENM